MKRRAILYITECDPKRFETLLFRKQLPFVPAPLPLHVEADAEQVKRRADYSVSNAFALRLVMDFADQGGLSLEAALYAGRNAVRKLDLVANGADPARDVYIVHVAEFALEGEDGDPMQIFACHLDDLAAVLAEKTDPAQVRRITLVNASATSRFVLGRAAEFGLFPDHDTRPAWQMAEVF